MLDKADEMLYDSGALWGTPIAVSLYAGMAELADALDSGSSGGDFVEVQILLPAPNNRSPNRYGSDFFVFTEVVSSIDIYITLVHFMFFKKVIYCTF